MYNDSSMGCQCRKVRALATVALTLLLAARVVLAQPSSGRAPGEQAAQPPPNEPGAGGAAGSAGSEGTLIPPKFPSPETVKKSVPVSGAVPDPSRSSANAGLLRSATAIAIREGEAQLQLSDGVRTLHVGDTIGGDVVRRVEADRLVLARPAGTHEDIVVVTFDAARHARVRVYATQDPNPVNAPPVK